MDRRTFFQRSALLSLGGLLTGNAALEMFERLAHRKVFALGAIPQFTNIEVMTFTEYHGALIPDGGYEMTFNLPGIQNVLVRTEHPLVRVYKQSGFVETSEAQLRRLLNSGWARMA